MMGHEIVSSTDSHTFQSFRRQSRVPVIFRDRKMIPIEWRLRDCSHPSSSDFEPPNNLYDMGGSRVRAGQEPFHPQPLSRRPNLARDRCDKSGYCPHFCGYRGMCCRIGQFTAPLQSFTGALVGASAQKHRKMFQQFHYVESGQRFFPTGGCPPDELSPSLYGGAERYECVPPDQIVIRSIKRLVNSCYRVGREITHEVPDRTCKLVISARERNHL